MKWLYGFLWVLFALQREKEQTERIGRLRAELMQHAKPLPKPRVPLSLRLPEENKTHG